MRKRILSLLCVMALCLGLLPVTVLAEGAPDGQVIYIGNENVTSTGYWTTDSDGNVTASTAGDTPTNNYIHYDAENNVLTLHNATIKKELNYSESILVGTYISGSAIGVFNLSGNAELTINLVGTNTIANVSSGIYVLANSNGGATLTVTGNGSLTTEGSGRGSHSGISVLSNDGNANLTINNVDVTATNSYAQGIRLQPSESASATLAVNGGSLTASGSKGIDYQFGTGATGSGTPSLTVSGNAIVRVNGGIINTDLQIGAGNSGSNGGIVWNGTDGTVYGTVELQEDLEIGAGETLTIRDGASLNTGSHEVIVNGGTLTGGDKITGTVKYAPTITTESLPDGTVDTTYNQTLGATGSETITWSLASGSTMPAGLTLNSDGTITGTPTTAGQFTFTATATNSAGSDSKEYELTINAPQNIPVNGVTLNPTLLSLFTGGSETLTATVEPSNATNKNVTWSSDKPEVATVENGKVTAKAAGTATITVTTEDGEKTATCTVTVTDKTYKISADATALDFGNAYTGYAQPAAKTVTITNDGNQDVTVTLPTSTNYIITAGTGFTNGSAAIEPDGTATFTVQPKAGLAVGTCSENITVTGTNNATLSITASFTVKQYSSGGGTPTKTPSQQAVDKIESAKDGSTVEIKLSTGSTKLDKEVFEELAGRDVTLEISVPGGIIWTVNGQDIPENADLTDLDMGVSLDASTIPVSVVNTITGAVDTIQLSLKHDGEFGFTMTLSAPLGKTNAGYWANLYYYNEDSRALEFQSADKIASDGTAEFAFPHASDYAIVIDTDSHEPVELPFTDVPEGAWYEDAAAYIYKHGLMAGTSATTFAPDVTTSRAMIATILWRMAGSPVVNYAMNYTDVAQGQWYSEAVRWATSEGVVTGYGNGLFGTNDPITREQLASILYRYAQTKGYDTSVGENTNILSYTDALEISEYAIPAMQWACGAGIMEGNAGYLTPQGDATRAQVATMLMRWMEQA